MSAFQWAIVGLCMLFNVINGLDVMAMAFTASSVSAQWGLSGAQLGVLLSASLVGMACGSMFAAPMADRHGRRPMILASLLLSGLCMTLSFCSQGLGTLMLLRGLTGLGVGAVVVGANVLTHEHASPERRSLAIALQSVAFGLGASVGGLLAHGLNESEGWRYVFLAGGGITLAAWLAGLLWLRESDEFLALGRQRQAGSTSAMPMNYRQLFAPAQWQRTLSLATALFLIMFSFYFVTSWTPTLLIQSGFSPKDGAAGGMLLSGGGMLGALLMGLGGNRAGIGRLLLGFVLLDAVLMGLIVPATKLGWLGGVAGFSSGLLLYGAIAGLFTLAPRTFPTAIRTSGVGLVLGAGRLGSIVSPAAAGLLIDAQWTTQGLFSFYAVSQLLAALLIWNLGRRP
jgi:predicted MFS family arabinose efflux permease